MSHSHDKVSYCHWGCDSNSRYLNTGQTMILCLQGNSFTGNNTMEVCLFRKVCLIGIIRNNNIKTVRQSALILDFGIKRLID